MKTLIKHYSATAPLALALCLTSLLDATGATLLVTSTNDTGSGSLRQAIMDANAAGGVDVIHFQIPFPGVQSLRPASPLPAITDPVTIDGTTQPGYAGTPLIEINGSDAGDTVDGLRLQTSNCVVRGLAINGFLGAWPDGSGIYVEGGGAHRFEANFLGTDPTGTSVRPNRCSGIFITNSVGNVIGSTNNAWRNLILGGVAGDGVDLIGPGCSNNVILGNFIGTDVTGNSRLESGPSNGIYLENATNNVVRGNLISGNGENGISMMNSRSNQLVGNIIGLSACGCSVLGNQLNGLLMHQSSDNLIGGTNVADRNVISGNRENGVWISSPDSTGNRILGNFIGLDSLGAQPKGNLGFGVRLESPGNIVGGTKAGARNVISGNRNAGVLLTGASPLGNRLLGNYIGLDADGNDRGCGNGWDGAMAGGPGNIIGGTEPGAGNWISGNVRDGVRIGAWGGNPANSNQVLGNFIGATVASLPGGNAGAGISVDGSLNVIGAPAGGGNQIVANRRMGVEVLSGTGNRIRGNAIYGNGGLGIDLSPAGVNSNDPLDADVGANQLQNYPVITAVLIAATNSMRITGSLSSRPSTTFTLEFFRNPTADEGGFGEGREFIGTGQVATDAAGAAAFSLNLAAAVQPTDWISATATDDQGNTSEFSRCAPVTRDLAGTADLAVRTIATTNQTALGTLLTYDISVTNLGPAGATNVQIQVDVPAGSAITGEIVSQGTVQSWRTGLLWGVGTLAEGATASAQVSFYAQKAGDNAGAVSVWSERPDFNPANDLAMVRTLVIGSDLGVNLVGPVGNLSTWGATTYTATVTNHGPQTATNLTVEFSAPMVGARVVSATATGGLLSSSGGAVQCFFSRLDTGQSAQLQVLLLPTQTGDLAVSARVSCAMDHQAANDLSALTNRVITGNNPPPEVAEYSGPPQLLVSRSATNNVAVGLRGVHQQWYQLESSALLSSNTAWQSTAWLRASNDLPVWSQAPASQAQAFFRATKTGPRSIGVDFQPLPAMLPPGALLDLNWRVFGETQWLDGYGRQRMLSLRIIAYEPARPQARQSAQFTLMPNNAWSAEARSAYSSPAVSGTAGVLLPSSIQGEWTIETQMVELFTGEIRAVARRTLLVGDRPWVSLRLNRSIIGPGDSLAITCLAVAGLAPQEVKLLATLTRPDGSQFSLPQYAEGLAYAFEGRLTNATFPLLQRRMWEDPAGVYQVRVRLLEAQNQHLLGLAEASFEICPTICRVSGTVQDTEGVLLGTNAAFASVAAVSVADGRMEYASLSSGGQYQLDLPAGPYLLGATVIDARGTHEAPLTNPLQISCATTQATLHLVATIASTNFAYSQGIVDAQPKSSPSPSASSWLRAWSIPSANQATDCLPKPRLFLIATGMDDPANGLGNLRDSLAGNMKTAIFNAHHNDVIIQEVSDFQAVLSLEALRQLLGTNPGQAGREVAEASGAEFLVIAEFTSTTQSRFVKISLVNIARNLEFFETLPQPVAANDFLAWVNTIGTAVGLLSQPESLLAKLRQAKGRPLLPELDLVLSATNLPGNANLQVTITARERDCIRSALTNLTVEVTVTTPSQQHRFQPVTDANGQAVLQCPVGGLAGAGDVQASLPGLLDNAKKTVSFRVDSPGQLSLSSPLVEIEPGTPAAVRATLVQAGQPVAGAAVNFSGIGGTPGANSAVTDGSGRAYVDFTAAPSSTPTLATVNASFTGTLPGQSVPVTLTAHLPFMVKEQAAIDLSASPSNVYSGGLSIVSGDFELGGAHLAGLTVGFNLNGGGQLVTNTAQTDANGQIQVNYLPPATGTGSATITATLQANGRSYTQNVQIAYSPAPQAPRYHLVQLAGNDWRVTSSGKIMQTDDSGAIQVLENDQVITKGNFPAGYYFSAPDTPACFTNYNYDIFGVLTSRHIGPCESFWLESDSFHASGNPSGQWVGTRSQTWTTNYIFELWIPSMLWWDRDEYRQSYYTNYLVSSGGQQIPGGTGGSLSDSGSTYWISNNIYYLSTAGGSVYQVPAGFYGMRLNSRNEVLGQAQGRYCIWTPPSGLEFFQNNSPVFNPFYFNDTGYTAGSLGQSYDRKHAYRSFLTGDIRDLGTLGGNWSEAFGVNSLGHVVGYSETSMGIRRPFLWRNGTMWDMTTLIPDPAEASTLRASQASAICGIDNEGRILFENGFLLLPLP